MTTCGIASTRTLLCVVALAATSLLTHSSLAQTGAANASLQDLAFVEGKWTGSFRGDRFYEAYWSAPIGNAIMGMLRFIQNDETTLFELLSVEHSDGGLLLRVKHFEPGLIGRQEKDDAVRYRLIEVADGRAVFQHETDPVRLSWEGGFDLVRRAVYENGEWVWSDLFVGERAN